MFRRFVLLRNPAIRATLAAGLAVIVVGVVCLYLSDGVVHQGWWQGTLDAFGVGFVVGGIIDVLAISALNVLYADDQLRELAGLQRHEISRQAEAIINSTMDIQARAKAAEDFLILNGREIPRGLHEQLRDLADGGPRGN